MEIELKFLINRTFSWLDEATEVHSIQQVYVVDTSDVVVRVRKQDDDLFLTIKRPTDDLAVAYEDEWKNPPGVRFVDYNSCRSRVHKTRYVVPFGDLKWEIDCFHGDLSGLFVAELELPSLDDRPTELPGWIGEEVTYDSRYKNNWLAKHGRPE